MNDNVGKRVDPFAAWEWVGQLVGWGIWLWYLLR
jgi:hypothetical protein